MPTVFDMRTALSFVLGKAACPVYTQRRRARIRKLSPKLLLLLAGKLVNWRQDCGWLLSRVGLSVLERFLRVA